MTNAKARFNNSLRPRKPEGSLGRTAQDGHLDSHTAPELCGTIAATIAVLRFIYFKPSNLNSSRRLRQEFALFVLRTSDGRAKMSP